MTRRSSCSLRRSSTANQKSMFSSLYSSRRYSRNTRRPAAHARVTVSISALELNTWTLIFGIRHSDVLEVGTDIEMHNKSLLGEGKIERFYLDVGRVIGNFHFYPLLQREFWTLMSTVRRGQIFFLQEGENRTAQCDKTHVTQRCGCSVPAAE